MRAAVLRGGRIEVRETPDPVPGPGQVLVKSLACAICASDLHFMDNPDGVAADTSGLWGYDADADIVMGHEFCTEVVAYGPDTRERWPVGTRISSQPLLLGAGTARIIGCANDAPGGFGEYLLLTESLAMEVPGDVPDEEVALADGMSVGWHYVRRAAPGPNDVPLVVGCGAIGLSVIAALRQRGVAPIVAVDFVPSRRDLAAEIGADVVVDPAERSPYAVWTDTALGPDGDTHRAYGNARADIPGCIVFECVGLPGVLDEIIMGVQRETRIFSAGGCPQGDFIHTMVAKRKGLNIQFGGGPMPEDFLAAFELICSRRLDVSPIVGRLVPLADTPQAIDDARRADGPARIVVLPWA
jgi:threonine dehydrogenase-like Zn-dependent dehydrogenase